MRSSRINQHISILLGKRELTCHHRGRSSLSILLCIGIDASLWFWSFSSALKNCRSFQLHLYCMQLASLTSLVILLMLNTGIATPGKVAFLATQIATVCPSTAVSRVFLSTFLTKRSSAGVRSSLLLGRILLAPLPSSIPFSFLLGVAIRFVATALVRRSSLTFLL